MGEGIESIPFLYLGPLLAICILLIIMVILSYKNMRLLLPTMRKSWAKNKRDYVDKRDRQIIADRHNSIGRHDGRVSRHHADRVSRHHADSYD